MASLREMKKRLKSIETTGQLAGAMRTAATAKYARLGSARDTFSPYADACRDMLCALGGAGLPRRTEEIRERDCVVILSGNRGMCGGFHAELFRFLDNAMPGFDEPLLLACGRKAAQRLRERGVGFEEYAVADVPGFDEIKSLARRIRELYETGQAARVFVVYQRFKNMLTQEPAAIRLLPEEDPVSGEERTPLLYLPDRDTIAAQLAGSCFDARMYELALENALGAQAATLMAMRSACDNANEAAEELSVAIHRRRQAEVTSGVIETASGNYQ